MATPRVGPLGIVTAKGDIITLDGNDVERLPVGADDEFLVADASAPTGMLWRKIQPSDENLKYLWFGITSNAETDDGAYATVAVGQNASINLTFHFPLDFGTPLTSLPLIEVMGTPNDTRVDKSFDFTSNYAAVGEDRFSNAQSALGQLFSFTGGEVYAIPVTSLFTNAEGGDIAGIKIKHNAIATAIRYYGLRMRYKPA